MQKKTHDYDNVFKTMKSRHKRLFISVINDIFGKNYPMDGRLVWKSMGKGAKIIR